MQIFEVVISIFVSVLAVFLTIRYRMVDYFDNTRQKYSENTEKVYMELLKVYTSDEFEEEALKFTQSIFDNNLNTTYYGKYHVLLMRTRKVNNIYNMNFFKEFAEEVEVRYWKEFNNRYFKIIVADTPIKSISQRMVKGTARILESTKTFQYYLLFIGIGSSLISTWNFFIANNTQFATSLLMLANMAILLGGGMQTILIFTRKEAIRLIQKENDHKFPQNFIKTQNIKDH